MDIIDIYTDRIFPYKYANLPPCFTDEYQQIKGTACGCIDNYVCCAYVCMYVRTYMNMYGMLSP